MQSTAELDLDVLRHTVAGQVAGPGRDDVAQAMGEVYNVAAEHDPAAVVEVRDADDVAAVLRWAAPRNVPVGVLATGHAGWPARGVLLHTRRLDTVTVDPVTRRAVVGAGVRWRQLLDAAAPHGLCGLCGSFSGVGVVGHAVGGGFGPLVRTFGRTADWVRRLSVVTGDGRFHPDVTAEHEPELFAALLGGLDTVGVVTEMEIELLELDRIYGGSVFYGGADAAAVLHAYVDWAPTLPADTTASIALVRLPDDPSVPEPLRGRLTVHLRVGHVGDATSGEERLAPMRGVATPVLDTVEPMPAVAQDRIHLDPPGPLPGWHAGAYLDSLDHEVAERLLAIAGPGRDVPLIIVELRPPNGPNAAAGQGCAGGRAASWLFGIIALMTPDLGTAVPALGRSLIDALAPWSTGTLPVNWCEPDVVPDAPGRFWDAADRERLTALSHRHDPAAILGGPRFGLRERP